MITEKEFKLKYLGKTINYLDIDWTVIGYHVSSETELEDDAEFEYIDEWEHVNEDSELYISRIIFASYTKSGEDVPRAWGPNSLNEDDVVFEPERTFIQSCVEFKIEECKHFKFI